MVLLNQETEENFEEITDKSTEFGVKQRDLNRVKDAISDSLEVVRP